MAPVTPTEETALAQLRGLTRVMDGAITIPGTGIRIGLDPILGLLLPVVGDWIGAATSGYIIVQGARLGASRATLMRMAGNLAVDLLVGSVPVLGDIFDMGFRANERNLALISAHIEAPERRRRSDLAVVVGVMTGLLVLAVATISLSAWLIYSLIQAVAGSF
ncbi:MAG TPA: DUF4112 domain-containing protein [Nannocystis sp.]|jgi:hypothetical protein